MIIFCYIFLHGLLTVLAHLARPRSAAALENGVPGPIRERDGGLWARFPDWRTLVSIPLTYILFIVAVHWFELFTLRPSNPLTQQLWPFYLFKDAHDPGTLLVLLPVMTLFFPFLILLVLTCVLTSQRNNPRFPIRGFVLKVLFLVGPFCLALALCWGYYFEPHQIDISPTSKVSVEIEKGIAKETEGRMLFNLDRTIILFNQDSTQKEDFTLIVVPHEKIQKIETSNRPL